jgi:hypothetical protein
MATPLHLTNRYICSTSSLSTASSSAKVEMPQVD